MLLDYSTLKTSKLNKWIFDSSHTPDKTNFYRGLEQSANQNLAFLSSNTPIRFIYKVYHSDTKT